jgi:hypothetical protein
MANVLKCSKKYWYDAFCLELPSEGAEVVAFDDAGDDDNPALITVPRGVWIYTFQPTDPIEDIMDRIFGSGEGTTKVTLDGTGVDPDPKAFRGGPNYGDDVQNGLMEGFLKTFLDAAEEHVLKVCLDYDRFDWEDGDGPLDKLLGHPDLAFQQMAIIAGKRNTAEVVYPKQEDAALLMKAVSIHPLQPLQNTFQRLVRDACRGIKDEEKRKEKESEQLANYVFVDSVPPKPLAPPKDPEPDTGERLEQCEKQLGKLEQSMEAADDGDAAAGKELKPRATAILNSLKKVREIYVNGTLPVPSLDQADRALQGVEEEIGKAKEDRDFKVIHQRLKQAHKALTKAVQSYCCVQNFHIIEPFYLFRLLVKFRITSDTDIKASTVTGVSSTVTGLLHNNSESAWLFTWLRDKLVQLSDLLNKNCGKDKAVFFLKGGRAAKYLQEIERKGENDWDTQIVINPNLRASQWYQTFAIVHNTVLAFLQQARAEFLVVATKNAASLLKGLGPELDKETDKDKAAAQAADDEDHDEEDIDAALSGLAELFADDDPDDLAPDKQKKNCKAELIDIGIPRRDTAEAFEQWAHVRPYLIECPDKIVIPGHLYYVNEYVTMIREAFADISISLPKTPKRVIRLLEVLKLAGLDKYIDEEKHHIPTALLPESLGKIAGLAGEKPTQHLLTVLLKQYMEAWDLKIDSGLAKHFDNLFKENVDSMEAKASYPGKLTDAIGKEKDYKPEHKKVADAIGFAQWLAKDFTEHLAKDRHKFNTGEENAKKYLSFVKAMYTGSFFGSGEDDLEVRLAVTGSLAALMHAKSCDFERMDELMPVTRLDMAIYCKGDADPATVLELLKPVIQTYLEHPKTPKYKMEEVGGDSLCLYWPEDVTIGKWSYTPLAIRIAVDKRPEDWPQLSFLKGVPVLGLRDLVWDHKRLTGDTEENFTYRKRRDATDALVDLLTRFENPDAGTPWVRPGFAGPDVPKQPPPPPADDKPKDKPEPDTSPKVDDGYGEFVVYFDKADGLSAPEYDDYQGAVTTAIFPNTAFAYLATNPDPGDVAAFAAGRLGAIATALPNVKADLSAVFLPRTLYDLFFLNRFVAQELKLDDFEKWKLRPMAQYSAAIVDPEVSKEAENVRLGWRLNQKIVKRLIGVGFDGKSALSQKQIDRLLADELATFRKQVLACDSDDKIKSKYKLTRTNGAVVDYSLGRKLNAWFSATLDGFEAMAKEAVRQECSAKAKVMLYRGSSHAEDRLDDGRGSGGMPISYNTGLLSGAVYDFDGNTFSPLYMLRADMFAYCIQIPWADLLKPEFPFHIPRTNALKQMFGLDQYFHAWTKAGPAFFVAIGNVAPPPGAHFPYLAYGAGGIDVLQLNYGPYIAAKIALK